MNEKNMSFETSLSRLEQIVRALERGDIALEDSLKLFQEDGVIRAQVQQGEQEHE